MYFFWGFTASTGAMAYAILWYGKESWEQIKDSWNHKRTDYDDPYLKLMEHLPRVPHWWYLTLLVICAALAIACLYEAGLQLPWW